MNWSLAILILIGIVAMAFIIWVSISYFRHGFIDRDSTDRRDQLDHESRVTKKDQME